MFALFLPPNCQTGRSRGTEQLSMKTSQQQDQNQEDQIQDKPELLVTAHERPIRGKLIVCTEETVKQGRNIVGIFLECSDTGLVDIETWDLKGIGIGE